MQLNHILLLTLCLCVCTNSFTLHLCDDYFNEKRKNPPSRFDYKFGEREEVVLTVYGFPLFIDSRDGSVSKTIRRTGNWEGGHIYMMDHFVKPGHKVLNIGSQTGLEALYMAHKVGPAGHLYVFEPFSFSFELMRKSVFLNNVEDWTTAYNMGANHEFATGIIDVPFSNTGMARVGDRSTYNKNDKRKQEEREKEAPQGYQR